MQKFKRYLSEANRINDLSIFSLGDQDISTNYNLVGDGTPTQLRDRIMMSLTWSEEFYKNLSSSYLLKFLIGISWLKKKDNTVGLDLALILKGVSNPEYLADLISQIPEDQIKPREMLESCHTLLQTNDGFKALQGLRTQLESLVLSDFGEQLSARDSGLNLFETIKNGKVAFLFLDSRRYGETAKAVGKFVLQDLKAVSARIDSELQADDRRPFSVIIDEFADLAQEDFISFLDRARSAKISVTVAHQEISDLNRISPEFAGRLMGNTSTLYAFLQKRPESAELISAIAGTKTTWKHTKQTSKFLFASLDTGNGSRREVEEFNIHPNVIKSLTVGRCVVVKKYPTSRSYLVNVHPEVEVNGG